MNKLVKTILAALFTSCTIHVQARELDSVKLTTGWVIYPGDTLRIGRGTMADRSFAYIGTNPNVFSTVPIPLGSGYAGLNLYVKRIKEVRLKGAKKIELVVGGGNIVNYRVQIEQAIETGEIIPPARYQSIGTKSVAVQPASVADELLKLKKLLDDGILTQPEYDAQKKKLLSQ